MTVVGCKEVNTKQKQWSAGWIEVQGHEEQYSKQQ
jgi:hypothetical protein